MTGISFNNIPGSGLVAPIFTAEVNSGGQYTSQTRFILIGHKTAAGSMALNTPVAVSAQNQVDAYAGGGSQLREMFRIAAQNAPATNFWIMAIDDSALTAMVSTITLASIVAGVGTCQICGETIQIPLTSTDTPTTAAAALAAAINGYYNPLTQAMLPITATSAAGVVTVTARNKGAMFNEIDFYVDPKIIGNVFANTGVWTLAQTTAGSGTPTTVAAALATLGDSPADFVVCPWTDSTSLASYSAWDNDVSGRWAWSRQSYGHVWSATLGNYSTLTTFASALNDRHLTVLGCVSPGANGTPHGSWLWISAIAARVSTWLSDITTGNVSRAQRGLPVIGLSPPRDASVRPNFSARNTLLQSGVSTWDVAADGTIIIDKLVTTYRTGVSGQPDAVFRDVQALYQVSGGLSFLRAQLGAQFGQRSLALKNPGNLGAIATPLDIQSALISYYQQLVNQGVFSAADEFATLLKVQINAGNPNRVDAFLPLQRVNPLDILAANATVYQQYPATLTP